MELLSVPAGPEIPRVDVSTPLAEIIGLAQTQPGLVLVFGAFRDGRGFSAAAALRARGYTGRLIASGSVLPDQVRHLGRSGFDAVEIGAEDPALWHRLADRISAAYPRQAVRDPHRTRPTSRPSLDQIAAILNTRYAEAGPATLIRTALAPAWGLKAAVLSSFGAETAVLLDVVAGIDPNLPVLFLDTGQHFLQTLSYRRALTEQLGLTDVRIVRPDPAELDARDPTDTLWKDDPDACCDLRKVRPLARAAQAFDLLLTGRKRHHENLRRDLPVAQVIDGSLRLNPLAGLTSDDIAVAFERRDLPPHPLVAQGYPSIGCWPCTRPAEVGGGVRSGRWATLEKTECGLHLPLAERSARLTVPG